MASGGGWNIPGPLGGARAAARPAPVVLRRSVEPTTRGGGRMMSGLGAQRAVAKNPPKAKVPGANTTNAPARTATTTSTPAATTPAGTSPGDPRDATYWNNVAANQFKVNNQINA